MYHGSVSNDRDVVEKYIQFMMPANMTGDNPVYS